MLNASYIRGNITAPGSQSELPREPIVGNRPRRSSVVGIDIMFQRLLSSEALFKERAGTTALSHFSPSPARLSSSALRVSAHMNKRPKLGSKLGGLNGGNWVFKSGMIGGPLVDAREADFGRESWTKSFFRAVLSCRPGLHWQSYATVEPSGRGIIAGRRSDAALGSSRRCTFTATSITSPNSPKKRLI